MPTPYAQLLPGLPRQLVQSSLCVASCLTRAASREATWHFSRSLKGCNADPNPSVPFSLTCSWQGPAASRGATRIDPWCVAFCSQRGSYLAPQQAPQGQQCWPCGAAPPCVALQARSLLGPASTDQSINHTACCWVCLRICWSLSLHDSLSLADLDQVSSNLSLHGRG